MGLRRRRRRSHGGRRGRSRRRLQRVRPHRTHRAAAQAPRRVRQAGTMLRRQPTRIEMRLEDVDEFDRLLTQQKKDKERAGHDESKTDQPKDVAGRIGLRSHKRSESPEY
mmetsp:Transcript_21203/g.68413  ORF Transcript_21203/g.68413 Transcript_21203/m.68413 type:complete len:110 (+) Transcript_21203:461-790(+)